MNLLQRNQTVNFLIPINICDNIYEDSNLVLSNDIYALFIHESYAPLECYLAEKTFGRAKRQLALKF